MRQPASPISDYLGIGHGWISWRLYSTARSRGVPFAIDGLYPHRYTYRMAISEAAHFTFLDSWDSGGGVMLDVIELDEDGRVVVIGEGTIAIYRTVADFWAQIESDDARDDRSTVTVLRETGLPVDSVAPVRRHALP